MLCHDVGHFGKTGKYVKDHCMENPTVATTSAEFCKIYKKYSSDTILTEHSLSPLEEFHSIMTNEILTSTGILDSFDLRKKTQVIDKVCMLIVSTDPNTTKNLLTQDSLVDSKDNVMKLLIKGADIGACLKQFEIHKSWSINLQKEFSIQGEVMRSRCMDVPSMFAGDDSKFVDEQLGFFAHYAKPLYEKVELLVRPQCLAQAWINYEVWKITKPTFV
jgi:hypothetical protein